MADDVLFFDDVRAGLDPDIPALLRQALASLDTSPACTRGYLDEIERRIAPPCVPLILIEPPKFGRGLVGWQIRRLDAYIDKNLSGGLKVAALAELLDLSPGHFSRAFKASLGEAPQIHIIRRRVRAAQRAMLTTNDPLSDIAVACGFTDQAHMSRMFRRFVGHAPSQWRRTHRVG